MIKKRLFLGLLAVSMLVLAGVIGYFWLTFFQQDVGLFRYLLIVAVVVVVFGLAVIMLGFSGIILSLLADKDVTMLKKPMNFTFALLYPVVMWLGKLFQITQEKIQSSFVEVNNQLVKAKRGKLAADRLLVLLPHCLQVSDCDRRMTTDATNCLRCGRCKIGDISELCERYGVHMCVATGGTLAREAVRKIRPHAIVAVACERDLTSGILDCIPLPVLGVTNERPNGPCHNTQVNLQALEKAILFLVKGGETNVISAR